MPTRSIVLVLSALAAGVVLGYVLGGVGPRTELVERDARIAALEEELEGTPGRGGWRSPVPGLDRILREPDGRNREGHDRGRRRDRDDRVDEDLYEAADGGVREPRWRRRLARRMEETPAEERLSAFERAVSIQNVRRVQSRAALLEQAELSDEEAAQVDAALGAMNRELVGHGEELIVLTMGDEPPAARDLLGITHDVTGILHRAQLELERIVGPARASEVEPSALEVWNHVDLGQLEPAARAAAEAAEGASRR